MSLSQKIEFYYKKGTLFSIAFKLAKNEDQAEELMHQAIERMLERTSLYVEDSSFLGFYKTTAFRILSNKYRDLAIRERRLLSYETPRPPSFEDSLHYKQIYKSLYECLNDKKKQLLEHKLQGYLTKDIADITGDSQTSINFRFHDIKNKLKSKFPREF